MHIENSISISLINISNFIRKLQNESNLSKNVETFKKQKINKHFFIEKLNRIMSRLMNK